MPETTRKTAKKPLSVVRCAHCHSPLMTPHCDTCGIYASSADATYVVTSCPECGTCADDDQTSCDECGATFAP